MCEVDLPAPEGVEELEDVKWNEVEFQTKSLMNALNYYVVAKDGGLYEKRGSDGSELGFWNLFDGDVKVAYVPCHYHGVIEFYTFFNKAANDYHVTFKAVFTRGELEELLLEKCEQRDNGDRLVKEAAFRDEVERLRNMRGKFWYGCYDVLYRRPAKTLLSWTRAFSQWLYDKSWKLERWLIRL